MRRAWILPALALACSRENPGFLLAETGAEFATTTTSTTTSPPTTAAASTGPATTGEPAPLCPDWQEPSLGLGLTYLGGELQPPEPPEDCAKVVSYRSEAKLSTNTLTLLDNENMCGKNVDGDFQVKLANIPIDVPIASKCFEVQVQWASDCSAIRSVLLLAYFPLAQQPREWFAAAMVGSASPPPGGPPGLTPTLILDQPCSCDSVSNECCMVVDLEGPGSYQLDFAGAPAPIAPGESVDITTTPNYTITNLRSHVHADCIDDPLHLEWYVLRTF